MKKISLSELANLLALESGESSELCLNFLRSFIKNVAESLEKGDNIIKIKGFGEFRIVDVGKRMSIDVSSGEEIVIPPHQKVVFIPSKRFAALVNTPFNMFEAIEVSENLDESDLSDENVAMFPVDEIAIEKSSQNRLSAYNEPEYIEDNSDEQESDFEVAVADSHEPELDKLKVESQQEYFAEVESSLPEAGEELGGEPKTERGYRFLWGFFSGFITAIVLLAIGAGIYTTLNPGILSIFVQKSHTDTEVKKGLQEDKTLNPVATIPTDNVVHKDSIPSKIDPTETDAPGANEVEKTVDTKPSDQKIIDTITKTRYLTTMARDHYGNYNLWPYIYIENQNILGHPDRIRPGTNVVIPSLSKYGVDPKSEKDIKEAKRKGVEIYARYK